MTVAGREGLLGQWLTVAGAAGVAAAGGRLGGEASLMPVCGVAVAEASYLILSPILRRVPISGWPLAA